MRIIVFSITLGAVLWFGSIAHGQARKAPAARLKEISAKLDEAIKSAADGTAALKALKDLQSQIIKLQQAMDNQQAMAQSFDAIRKKVTDYDTRLGNLELALDAVKMQVSGKVATAGFKDGFFIQSSNKKFLLRIGGLFQGGYEGQLVSDKTDSQGQEIAKNDSTFVLRRTRVGLSGYLLNWRIAYRMEFELGPLDPGPVLEGWSELRIHRMLRVRGGRQKIPFGRQFLIHAAYQQFIERIGVTNSFAPGWDLGLSIRGDVPLVGILSYQVGIFNGAGSLFSEDNNTDFIYTARMVYQPLGPITYAEGDAEVSKIKICLGGSFFYNLMPTDRAIRKGITDPIKAKAENDVDKNGQVDNVEIWGANAELTMRFGGLAWQNEFFYRLEDSGSLSEDRDFWGIYSQGSFFHFSSTLELAMRYGFWQPNFYGMARTIPRPEEIHELAVVINALTWGRRFKWQMEYSHQWQKDLKLQEASLGTDLRVHQFKLQMQMAW